VTQRRSNDTRLLADVARVFEAIGVAALVIGLIWSLVIASLIWRAAGGRRAVPGAA
jgi:hypothetical protein